MNGLEILSWEYGIQGNVMKIFCKFIIYNIENKRERKGREIEKRCVRNSYVFG